MTFPAVQLRNVVRISASSIFFTPPEGATLDFNTVSSTPSSHRGALQNNGIIAKICVGVTINASDVKHRKEAEELLYGPEGRLKLWSSLLVANGLIEAESDVVVPTFLSRESWPLISNEEFDRRIKYYAERKKFDAVNQSPFCASILGMTQWHSREHGISARMCVIWMPRYASDLISWSECHVNSGRSVPEQKLTTIVRHVTSSLLTITTLPPWNSQPATSNEVRHPSEEVMGQITNLEMEDVLVNEEGTDLTFLLTASPFQNLEKLIIVSRDTTYQKLQFYPYLAPEQIIKMEAPMLISSPRYAVWALGMMIYAIASAVPSLGSQLQRLRKRKGELPLNHPEITPDVIIKRIQRDLEPGGYSPALSSLIALLLSTDHLTRPHLDTIDQMMPDLNRVMPILRFPFALGSFDLLHLPEPEKLQLNARARKYISQDICCVCKKGRNLLTCKRQEHSPAVTSPCWVSDEPLPGVMSNENVNVTFLYPLAPTMDERDLRRKLNHAIPSSNAEHTAPTSTNVSTNLSALAPEAASMNLNIMFQLFGGFAFFDRVAEEQRQTVNGKVPEKVTVKDVMLLYPRTGIRKSESPWTPKQLHFSAAFPWPSFCTASLQKKGRIMTPVPPIFGGTSFNAKWFAWILPGERFILPNGREWVLSDDGGFVFWFNDMLEPSDQDRYFILTSLRALTLPCRVLRTTMPEHVFRKDNAEDSTMHSVSYGEGMRNSNGSTHLSAPRQHTNSNSLTLTQLTKEESHDRSASRLRPSTHTTRRPQLRVNVFNQQGGKEGGAVVVEELPEAAAKRSVEPVRTADAVERSHSPRPERPNNKTNKILRDVNTNEMNSASDKKTSTAVEKEVTPIPSADSTTEELKISNISTVSAISHRTPLIREANPIQGMKLYGCWYTPGVVEVAFEALTFWVPSTGEHGHCHAPVSVTESIRNALRLPLEAAYMSFLSNDIPLLIRNHVKARGNFSDRLLLAHHGLAFFAINSTPLGVLALRCCVDRSSASTEEVPIPLRRHEAIPGTRQRFHANYFDVAAPLSKTGSVPSSNRLRHSAPASAVPRDRRKMSAREQTENPSCASSRLMEDGAGFSLAWDDQVPVSWMGFDAEQSTLVFTDSLHGPWYPVSITNE